MPHQHNSYHFKAPQAPPQHSNYQNASKNPSSYSNPPPHFQNTDVYPGNQSQQQPIHHLHTPQIYGAPQQVQGQQSNPYPSQSSSSQFPPMHNRQPPQVPSSHPVPQSRDSYSAQQQPYQQPSNRNNIPPSQPQVVQHVFQAPAPTSHPQPGYAQPHIPQLAQSSSHQHISNSQSQQNSSQNSQYSSRIPSPTRQNYKQPSNSYRERTPPRSSGSSNRYGNDYDSSHHSSHHHHRSRDSDDDRDDYHRKHSSNGHSSSLSASLLRAVETTADNEIALFKRTKEATNSLYVDGVPVDSNEREVSHVFRPYPGFQGVRLIKKRTQAGREFYFCFVDFTDALCAAIALRTLQGYRFDKNDTIGMKISFASENHQTKKAESQSSSSTSQQIVPSSILTGSSSGASYSQSRSKYSDQDPVGYGLSSSQSSQSRSHNSSRQSQSQQSSRRK